MTTVYLIRHAEAEGNVYHRFHGWYNSVITGNGYRQIEALSRRFAGERIDAVYSSDLFRTMTTARAIYQPRGLELHADPDLREIGGGVWEDRTWGQIHRDNAASLDAFSRADPAWHVQGSETYGAVQMRMTAALRRIAAAHEGQTVAVFSHGTAIRTVLAKFYGYPLDQIDRVPHGDNTCVSKLLFDGDTVTVEYINDNSHLGELSTMGLRMWRNKDGAAGYGKYNLWFRPLDFKTEGKLYFEARQEAWKTIHHTMQGFNGYGFLRDAENQSHYDIRSVMVAMQEDTPAGVLQLDMCRDADKGVGGIPFFYLTPETRAHGLGIQLLGQAIGIYRPMGREYLRLRCAPENDRARRFYEKNGFRKIGEEAGGLGSLDVLEKYFGYEAQSLHLNNV